MMRRPARNGDAAKSVNPHDTRCTASWWTHYAQPEQRAHFIEAAHVRDRERTKAEDVREGKKNQAMRHIIAPKMFPAKRTITRQRKDAE